MDFTPIARILVMIGPHPTVAPLPLKLQALTHQVLMLQKQLLNQLKHHSIHQVVQQTFPSAGLTKHQKLFTKEKENVLCFSISLTERLISPFVRLIILVTVFWQKRTVVTSLLKPWLPVTSKFTFSILRICTTLLVMFSNVMMVANHMLLSAGQRLAWMAVMTVLPRKIKCTLCSAVLTQSSLATRTLMNALDKLLMV